MIIIGNRYGSKVTWDLEKCYGQTHDSAFKDLWLSGRLLFSSFQYLWFVCIASRVFFSFSFYLYIFLWDGAGGGKKRAVMGDVMTVNPVSLQELCVFVAAMIHYFYLVGFAWMLFEGVYLYLMVVKVFNAVIRWRLFYGVAWGKY